MPPSQAMKIRIESGFAVFALLVYALVGELVWPFFLAAGVHELSHLAAVWLLGGKVKTVTLRFADAQIMTAPMGYAEEAACALAGPAANLLCCWLFRFWAPAFAALSLLLGCYNLLPVFPLDGGRALRCVLEWLLSPKMAKMVERVLVCTVLAAVCSVILWLDRSLSMGGILILIGAFGIAKGIFRKIPCKETVLRVQ